MLIDHASRRRSNRRAKNGLVDPCRATKGLYIPFLVQHVVRHAHVVFARCAGERRKSHETSLN